MLFVIREMPINKMSFYHTLIRVLTILKSLKITNSWQGYTARETQSLLAGMQTVQSCWKTVGNSLQTNTVLSYNTTVTI